MSIKPMQTSIFVTIITNSVLPSPRFSNYRIGILRSNSNKQIEFSLPLYPYIYIFCVFSIANSEQVLLVNNSSVQEFDKSRMNVEDSHLIMSLRELICRVVKFLPINILNVARHNQFYNSSCN